VNLANQVQVAPLDSASQDLQGSQVQQLSASLEPLVSVSLDQTLLLDQAVSASLAPLDSASQDLQGSQVQQLSASLEPLVSVSLDQMLLLDQAVSASLDQVIYVKPLRLLFVLQQLESWAKPHQVASASLD